MLEIMDHTFQSFTVAMRSFFVKNTLMEEPVSLKKVAVLNLFK